MPSIFNAVGGLSYGSGLGAMSSLAPKLLRIVLGIYLAVAISVTVVQLLFEYENEKTKLVSEIEHVALTFGPILAQSIWNFDEGQISVSLNGMLGINKDVLAVQITDVDDAILYSLRGSQKSEEESVLGMEDSILAELISVEFPLRFENEYTPEQILGNLTLYTSPKVVLLRVSYTFFITVISACIKTTILWFIFYIVINRVVAQPLKQLSDAMANLNPDTEEEVTRIEFREELLTRDDELGQMLRTFEAMEGSLVKKSIELHQYQEKLEDKVAKRTLQLEKASRAKTDFLASMSHEIRTPMNGVLGMAQLLKETPLNGQQSKYLSIILTSGNSLLEVINGILDHLKIEAGKVELEERAFDLESIIDDCTAIFSYKSRESKVQIIPVLRSNCSRYFIGDSTRVRQIITNLLGNAFKFTRQGEIILEVREVGELDNHKVLIRISVKDTGVGISEDVQKSLFSPFTQADSSTTRKYGGTGLGLSICKQLTDLMQGSIGVISEVGKGSEFWVELPFKLTA